MRLKRAVPSKSIVVTEQSTRPLKSSKDGHVLSNEETIQVLVDNLDKYEKDTDSLAPLDPNFREWLKECKQEIETGEMSVHQYIKKTVARRINIAQCVKNTNKTLGD